MSQTIAMTAGATGMNDSEMVEHAYPTVDLTGAAQSIAKLHDHVCAQGKRVEIVRPDCDERCVMISKSELDSLENAIEIFANTREFEAVCQNIQQLLETAGVVYHPPAV